LFKIMIIGGIPESLVNFRGDLIRRWCALGHKVVALSAPASESLVEAIKLTGARFRPIPIRRASLNPLSDFKTIISMIKIIREEKPDKIFSYTIKPVIYTAFSLMVTGVKAEYYPMITGLGYTFSGTGLKRSLLNKVSVLMYRLALKRSRVVFFQNKDDLQMFKNLNIISPDKETVVTNGSGVNIGIFNFCKAKNNQELSFLLIGRLLFNKGLREYIEAAKMIKAKYPLTSFKLLGAMDPSPDSINQADLTEWQEEGLIEHYPQTDEVRPYLRSCSVYVLPSYREGTPRSVLEAMAMGRPIITTDAPGCRETVEEGVNGFLVPVKDSRALAEAMERFIDNPDLIERMGRESRRIAEEKYDVHKVNNVINRAMGLI